MTPEELTEWIDTHCSFCGKPLEECDETDCPVRDELIRKFDEAVAAGEILLTAPPEGWDAPVEEQDCE